MRGLKPDLLMTEREVKCVAPLVGAWIETPPCNVLGVDDAVAPLVGAWIETVSRRILLRLTMSHPSWVRGLKPKVLFKSLVVSVSHPSWVRGLKLMTGLLKSRY